MGSSDMNSSDRDDDMPTLSGVTGSYRDDEAAEGEGPPAFPNMRVIEEIAPGKGGMGKVYRAREETLDRIVAIKTVRPKLLNAQGRSYFEQEAKATAKLEHPQIVRIHSFNPDHNPPYYVMQYVDGIPLDEACQGVGPEVSAGLVEQAARAIAFAHRQGFVHRDVKPANILVTRDNKAYVTDFGLALQWSDENPGAPVTGKATGTWPFIAPEVYQADQPVGPAVDIYAMGVTIYLLLTKRLPFHGTPKQIAEKAAQGDVPMPIELDPNVPEPLQRICLKAMEPKPENRYESMKLLADDLARFIDGRQVTARPSWYRDRLEGLLHNHIAQVEGWRENSLITTGQMDAMIRPCRRVLEADSPWEQMSQRFPWETVALRIGGWVMLVSSLLWPVFYWNELDRPGRLFAVGLPTVVLNTAGWLLWRWRHRRNALIFLSTGALLLPLMCVVCLAEFRLAAFPQPGEYELYGETIDTIYAMSAAELSAHIRAEQAEHGVTPDLPPTNMHLLLGCVGFIAYGSLLLWRVRARIFVVWMGIAGYCLLACTLLRFGYKPQVLDDRLASLLVWACLFSSAYWLIAQHGRAITRRGWRAALYMFFPVPFAVFMSALAYYGAVEWFDAADRTDSIHINFWLMLNGVAYGCLAFWSLRRRASHLRFWGEWFLFLVPASLLLPCNFLYRRGFELGRLGDNPVHVFEALTLVVVLALIPMGTILRRAALTIPGLCGLFVFLFRTTREHFADYVSWPAALAVLGAMAMLGGLCSAMIRARLERADTPS